MCPVLLVFSGVDMLGVGMAIGCVVAAGEGTPGRAGNKATFFIAIIYNDRRFVQRA